MLVKKRSRKKSKEPLQAGAENPVKKNEGSRYQTLIDLDLNGVNFGDKMR